MGQENLPPDIDDYEPGGLVISQVQWAWLWSSIPWLVVVVLLYYTQWVPLEELTTSVLLIIILVPRFIIWRRTRYIVTDDTLVYKRGGILSARAVPLPIWRIKDVQARYGVFGRALGYQMVDVMMDNSAVARLSYVPIPSDFEVHLRARMAEVEPPPDANIEDDESPPEDPPPSSPSDSNGVPDDRPST